MSPAMRFDQSQSMRMGQQMKLAPRMIQSMEILQMSLAELEERIEQELSSNPTLELEEREADPDLKQESVSTDGELDLDGPSGEDDFARLDQYEEDHPDAADNSFEDEHLRQREEIDWRHEAPRSSSRLEGEPDARLEMLNAAPDRHESLQEQLLRQWAMVDVIPKLKPAGEAIIGNLDDDGYLRVSLEEIAEKSPKPSSVNGSGWPPTIADLEMALQAIQLLLEPAGIGARDARECLLLQLDAQLDLVGLGGPHAEERMIASGETIRAARTLVREHYEDLLKNRLPKIADASGLTLDEIRAGIDALKRLSLAPGKRLVSERAQPITPDAFVEYDDVNDRYVAYLNDRRLPNLQINREYALLSKDRSLEARDRDFIKKNLSNATWLMDAVEQRRSTLLRVINVVLQEQREFFDVGPEALKPLPMTQVAEQLGIHVATVSRAVSEKHLQTPRGIVALRGFFSGGLQTESGEDMSYDAVRAALKDVVENEDKSKPLSDEAIVKVLNDKGIEIARRTVAKYRGQLGIPSARMRKQF
ncbi:MAG: RNA polymerase factor sigma-54 [Planctomycetota bacterium]